MSDSLSHFFSHIQNSQKNKTLTIFCNSTKIFISILKILQENGYIRGYRVIYDNKKYNKFHTNVTLAILLKYKNQKPAIQKFIRISKPSKRIYIQTENKRKKEINKQKKYLPNAINFMQGLFILSTSYGILSNTEAFKLNVGGELLGQVR